ncbi:MAG TPA: ABC transporter permease [Hyphomicrobiaceae bacterium]|jgi:peptide/nickel transport system permease protein|nr:ABC transporter permease [Hyphomicrobiaceae bacterium]
MATIATTATDTVPKRPNPVWQFIKAEPSGVAGLFMILLYVVFAFGAAGISPYNPEEIDFAGMLSSPSAAHWFGTDQYGRDVFSRIVYGSRTALAVGILSAVIGCTLGALIGAASGYFSGRIDNAIQRVVDIMLSFPIIVLAMVVVAVLGKRSAFGIDFNLIAAIALPIVPRMARVSRASTLSIVAMPFIDAARAAGFGHSRIILRHIVPNIVAPYLIMVSASMAQAILLEASLSFLGLGVTEPTPAWGLMLSGASADFYQTAPWMILFPGVAITLAVFAFNLFGDSLRDWLDPKLKS